MKHDYIQKQVQNLNPKSIADAFNGTQPTILKLKVIRTAVPNHPSVGEAGGRLCKGPPGRPRSPGMGNDLFPGHPPDTNCKTFEVFKTSKVSPEHRPVAEIVLNTECRYFTNNQILIFYKHLNFTIMKKQILILAFFILAILAGTKSYAQELNYVPATACAPVTALPCATDDALHPIPGKIYNYTVTVNPGVTTGNVQWFVYNTTANPDAIVTGGSIAAALTAAEANGGASQFLLNAEAAKYKSATNTSGSIDVSWQSFNGTTTEILLVAYVQGNGSCSDNIEVFRIEPIFAFTLDIAGLMPAGTLPASGNALECVSPVQSATYGGTNLTMDYGENYVFFTVTAANFVHSWQPTFTLTNNTQSTVDAATDITWAYPDQAILAAGTWNAVTAPVLAKAASGAVGAAGECIIVRVKVDHNNNENDAAAARNIILGVDGKMYNVAATNYTTASLQDLDPSAAAPCTNTATDQAQYDLTPRPQITESAPAAPAFEPKN